MMINNLLIGNSKCEPYTLHSISILLIPTSDRYCALEFNFFIIRHAIYTMEYGSLVVVEHLNVFNPCTEDTFLSTCLILQS